MVARDVDALVAFILNEIDIPMQSLGGRFLGHLADLRRILSANYLEAPGLPSLPLLQELSLLTETEIRPYITNWKNMDDSPELLCHLSRIFGGSELELRAEPYLRGVGLTLRGFFCRADLASAEKFIIFLNTAHHPGAVSATLGHELGHYIHRTLVGGTQEMTMFMEGDLSGHIEKPDELFSDSLVALNAYPREMMRSIGVGRRTPSDSPAQVLKRIHQAYDFIRSRFKLNLKDEKLPSLWRVRYLASMTHFFKLRCALFQVYDI